MQFQIFKSRGQQLAAISLLFVILAGGLILPATAAAQEKVQLASFPVRVFNISGANAGMRPVTLFMGVATKEHAQYVCALAPRVRAAILQELNRAPVYMTPDDKMPLADIGLRLKPVIESALRVRILTDIEVVDGVRKLAAGTAAKLPSAQTGCTRVSTR